MGSKQTPVPDCIIEFVDSSIGTTRCIRVLELRCADGAGGGPEKTILAGAARSDPARVAVTVCYLHRTDDTAFNVKRRAADLDLDYVEIAERRRFDLRSWKSLRQMIRAKQIDLVHAHDYKSNLLALGLARCERVVPLSTAHGWTGHTRRERWLYYPVDRLLLRSFPLVIGVSHEIRDALVRSGVQTDRVRVVLNGIDQHRFRRNPANVPAARARFCLRNERLAVGAVGRLEPQKRYDRMLEAFAALLPRWQNLELLVAGEGSCRRYLESYATRLGIGSRVTFLGNVSDIIKFHHALNVFVQSSDYEGTPNSILEAMAMETPIVTTDAGGTRELVEDQIHALVVPPNNPVELANAIETALTQPSQTASRVDAARRRVEGELSFDKRMATVEGIYRELTELRSSTDSNARGLTVTAQVN